MLLTNFFSDFEFWPNRYGGGVAGGMQALEIGKYT